MRPSTPGSTKAERDPRRPGRDRIPVVIATGVVLMLVYLYWSA